MAETTNSQGFVHLRVRSAYSLLEGAIKAGKIGKMAADAGMPAVAVADRANLFGALEFSQTTRDAGVQPIIACALPVLGIGGQIMPPVFLCRESVARSRHQERHLPDHPYKGAARRK